jgi:myo-inositol-1(or 4)-monophosphatase
MPGMRSFLVELAKTGGKIAREHFQSVTQKDVRAKAARDYVSHVDRLVEDAIVRRIQAHYPDHLVVAEESAAAERPAPGQPYWVVDPIDGTTNFIHGIPAFAVSIACCDDDGAHTGVVYDPVHNEVFVAERGIGLWLGQEQIHTSGCRDLDRALIATALPFRFQEALGDSLTTLGRVSRVCDDIRRGGAAALDLAYVAVGRLDAYFELGIYPWDTAAGELLVACGGGKASDFRGSSDNLLNRRSLVCAATPDLHAALLHEIGPLADWLDRPPFARS